MPCNLQSAIAGWNSKLRPVFVNPAQLSGVEDWVPRNKDLQTPPGPGGSSGKYEPLCAGGLPGWSRLVGHVREDLVKARCAAIFNFL